MKIIAIVVTYNGIKWYERCFGSLRSSNIPVQTVVIDNSPSDETTEYIKKNYPEIHLVKSAENLGFGKANNIGLRYAIEQKADFVLLLNQDAWIKPDTIEKLATAMDTDSRFGILSPVHLTGTEGKLDHGFSKYFNRDYPTVPGPDLMPQKDEAGHIYPVSFVNAAIWLMSRDCLNDIGGFDPLFPHYGEDYNYITRLRFHKYKIGILSSAYAIHDRDSELKKELSFKQRKNKIYVAYLMRLLDINTTLLYNLGRLALSAGCAAIKNILCLSFSGFIIELFVSFSLISSLPTVIKHRKVSKRRGLNFL